MSRAHVTPMAETVSCCSSSDDLFSAASAHVSLKSNCSCTLMLVRASSDGADESELFGPNQN